MIMKVPFQGCARWNQIANLLRIQEKKRGSSKESRGRIVIIGVSGKAAKSLTLEVAIDSAIGETRNDYGERDRATTSR